MTALHASPLVLDLDDSSSGPSAVVKDTIDVAGVPTRCGSRALENAPPATRDAAVVERLRVAGWRMAGKTYLHELAFGTTGVAVTCPSPRNPRWPALVPGGSSTGSAIVVASGLAELALGTDTGGSIRVPAACCGVYGLKPTFGLVDRGGVAPAQSSLDCVGPLAADMGTLIKAMGALVPGFAKRPLPRLIRIGALRVRCEPRTDDAVAASLAAWEQVRQVERYAVTSPLLEPAFAAGIDIINHETWAAWGHLLETGRVGDDVAARLRMASRTTRAQIIEAERIRRAFRTEIDRLLDRCDFIALPTLSGLPPRVEDAGRPDIAVVMTSLVRPFNLSGHPAISIPIERHPAGPYSLQLIARRNADEFLCSAAEELAGALETRIGTRQCH
ncbi:MAG: amidase [Lautropia sp.]